MIIRGVWKRGVCLIWTLCKLFTLIPCLWCTLPWSLIYCDPCLINGGSCNQSAHALCLGCSHLAASCHTRHQWRDALECMAADHRLQPAQFGCEEFWRLPLLIQTRSISSEGERLFPGKGRNKSPLTLFPKCFQDFSAFPFQKYLLTQCFWQGSNFIRASYMDFSESDILFSWVSITDLVSLHKTLGSKNKNICVWWANSYGRSSMAGCLNGVQDLLYQFSWTRPISTNNYTLVLYTTLLSTATIRTYFLHDCTIFICLLYVFHMKGHGFLSPTPKWLFSGIQVIEVKNEIFSPVVSEELIFSVNLILHQ